MKHDIASVAYRGEIWTDGRGRALVALPTNAAELAEPIGYTLEAADAQVNAVIAVGLEDGRFAIKTDEPHVKVAWRIVGASAHTETHPGRKGA